MNGDWIRSCLCDTKEERKEAAAICFMLKCLYDILSLNTRSPPDLMYVAQE